MSGFVIDGKAIAEELHEEITKGAAALLGKQGIVPGLAVVLVGNDPASETYVRAKVRRTVAAGMRSFMHHLPADAREEGLLGLIERLNRDPAVDGILVQVPLPNHIDADLVMEAIDPAKDVDGFHPVNVGRTVTRTGGIVPCTPLGCLKLIKSIRQDLTGMDALIIGSSNIVGRPMAQLLLAQKCTVTLAHIDTRDVPDLCRRADLVVVAVGRPQLVRGDWIKPGAIVIDVGINRIPGGPDGKARIVGDVAFEEAKEVAGAITPVPGGVGPMTIACLLLNTLQAAQGRQSTADPEIKVVERRA